MTAAIDSRPLSFSERSRLLAGAVKVLFVLLPFVLYLVFLTRFFGPPVPLFYLLMAASQIPSSKSQGPTNPNCQIPS